MKTQSKNHPIHARLTKDVKEMLLKKAEKYGSMANFLEMIARYDIVILDDNAAKMLRCMFNEK